MAPRGRGLDLIDADTVSNEVAGTKQTASYFNNFAAYMEFYTLYEGRYLSEPHQFREIGRRKMSKYDRQFETVDGSGQKIIMHEGPAEIASWFFPNETPEDDKRRIALYQGD